MYDRIVQLAKTERRTVSNFALLLLEDGLAQGVTNCNASAAKPKAKVRA
jgi:hypothetical protein